MKKQVTYSVYDSELEENIIAHVVLIMSENQSEFIVIESFNNDFTSEFTKLSSSKHLNFDVSDFDGSIHENRTAKISSGSKYWAQAIRFNIEEKFGFVFLPELISPT